MRFVSWGLDIGYYRFQEVSSWRNGLISITQIKTPDLAVWANLEPTQEIYFTPYASICIPVKFFSLQSSTWLNPLHTQIYFGSSSGWLVN